MQLKSMTYLEHEIAPRLERDIHELYLNIREKRGGEYNSQYWLERLLGYIQDWHMLFVTNEYYFGIWLDKLRSCYLASQCELKIWGVSDVEQSKKLLTLILTKLESIFRSVYILEELKDKTEKHIKQIERYQNEYAIATEHCYNLNKINVLCAYQPEYAHEVSIFTMAEHIRTFNKYIKQRQYFPTGYLYWYKRVVRIPVQDQYVMILSLTVNSHIFNDLSHSLERLQHLWSFATGYTGALIDIQDETQKNHELVCQLFSEFDDQEDLDGLLKRDIVNTSKDSMGVRVWPLGFKHFIGTSGK